MFFPHYKALETTNNFKLADELSKVERDEKAVHAWLSSVNSAEPDEISTDESKRDSNAVPLWPSHVDKAEPDEVSSDESKRDSEAIPVWPSHVDKAEPDEVAPRRRRRNGKEMTQVWELANNQVE